MMLYFLLHFIIIIIIGLPSAYCIVNRECPKGEFILPSMFKCQPLLNCTQLGKINVANLIGVGGVKAVYNASWNNYSVALSLLNNPKFIKDFHHGQDMLLEYSGYPGFIRLIGHCKKPALTLTELHPYGSVANLSLILSKFNNINDNIKFRIQMCHDWSKILKILHGEGPIKNIRIMCDSNSIKKLLSQILLDKNLNLILNDLDALPQLSSDKGVICGHGPIEGELVAPEQKWPFPNQPFNESLMPGYNEKIDIWKSGKLCEYFLNITNNHWIKYRLFNLHKKCLKNEPYLRPCASELVQEYYNVLMEVTNHNEL
jgi:glycoprotein-mannosyl O6-kinase